MNTLVIWAVPGLFMASLGGLAYFTLQALRGGAEDYAVAYAESAARQMEDLFLFIPPRRVMELAMAAAATCALLTFMATGGLTAWAFLRGVVSSAVAGALGWQVPKLVLRGLKRRRLQRFNEQLTDSLVTMSNALKAGFSIPQAIELVVKEGRNPIAQEFGAFLHQMRVGMRMEDAFESLRRRVGSDDLTLMIMSIEVARQTGGSLTEVFEKIADTIRGRLRIEHRIRTLTAQQRLQGIVVGLMPIPLGLLMLADDPRMMMSFLNSTFGWVILGIVILLEAMGAFFIYRIVQIDV